MQWEVSQNDGKLKYSIFKEKKIEVLYGENLMWRKC